MTVIDPNLDADLDSNEGWVEIPREEALERIERFLTLDIVAFEIEHTEDPTPIGSITTYTWFTLDEAGDQHPVLLAYRETQHPDVVRWFVRFDLTADQPV
jgi:hypothetical protein